jgi:hypothetical protein
MMSLSDSFARVLSNASEAYYLPTVDDKTQELIQACINDLNTLQSRVATLSVFSPNESLEDIGTRDLVYLFVPYALSELYGRVRASEREERLQILDQGQKRLEGFLFDLENYHIVSETDRALYQQRGSMIRDARQRREVKIKQYQKEKELRSKLETIRKRRGIRPVEADGSNDFNLICMLLPSEEPTQSSDDEEELDSETDDAVREATLLLLRIMYAQAQNRMENTEQERELLKNAPPPSPPGISLEVDTRRGERGGAEEDLWRLDAPSLIDRGPDGKGPLLDEGSKPLRPFTILPSSAPSGVDLKAQIFGPSHRLPTMTIDEYLEIERQRGNILTGGGRASQEAPTSTEKLTLASEMEGTCGGEEKAEELRQRQEKWAQFTDVNPKGAGNSMNRG